jgi:hypothetical protein
VQPKAREPEPGRVDTGVDAPVVAEPIASAPIPTPRPPRRSADVAPISDPQPIDPSLQRSAELEIARMPSPEIDLPPPLAPQTARPPPRRAPVDVEIPAPPRAPLEAIPLTAPRLAIDPVEIHRDPPTPTPGPVDVAVGPRAVDLPPAMAIAATSDAIAAFARAVASRVTGVLRVDQPAGIRRIILQDGDVVTAASSCEGESLIGFLAGRGDLPQEVAQRLEGRVPPFGRLSGAALVAHGHLQQDQLWDVLQAHAAWLVVRTVTVARGQLSFEREAPARLRGEPPVFGGTPGPALVVEIARRAIAPADAIARLGGANVRLAASKRLDLLDECGLEDIDDDEVRNAGGVLLADWLTRYGDDAAPAIYALVLLGVVDTLTSSIGPPSPNAPRPVRRRADTDPGDDAVDPVRDAELDIAAVRARIVRRRALVDDGDYFAILGVARDATGYEIKLAYLDLRRSLDPARVLVPALADLADDLGLVNEVVDEAYELLKDPTRRERYRRAISREPPKGV